ncbi:DNA repair protein RadC [Olavius sp. associated proteobacterium Delta 1]|nr:DNA repair protein RadC [Olavius sp. associated proteobacterium Delta 1]
MTERARFWEDLRSGRFVSMVEESSKGRSVANSKEVYNIMKPLFAKEDDVEKVYFIFLDAQNKILSIENLFTGTISASTIYPRELIKRLLALKSCAFIMVHNHPSGNTMPSEEDISITMKLAVASSGIDVLLHDHIIIGDGLYSMADMGLMEKIKNKCNNLLATVNQL